MGIDIHVSLSEEAERRLRQRAKEAGVAIDAIAAKMLEQDLTARSIDELLTPVREDFAKTGMSPDDILDLGRRELDELRKDKRNGSR